MNPLHPLRRPAKLALLAGAGLLVGCSSPQKETVFIVLPGEYEAAFDATRDVLTDARFTLDRVDAAAGVITTYPKSTSGLATPWDTEQSTFGQEWEDFTNQQERMVRVTFAPEGEEDELPGPGEALPDRRSDDRPLVARVDVTVLRLRRPGWRPETEAISRSSRSQDPQLASRVGGATFSEPIGRDERLAGRLGEQVRARLSAAGLATGDAAGDPVQPE